MSKPGHSDGPDGQILIIFAFVILGVVFLLAWAVDGGRIAIRRAETRRGAEAAANAAMVVVGDQMLTQVPVRLTEGAARPPCIPDGDYGAVGVTCTATPQPGNIPAWLTDADRAELVAPPLQTAVATAALDNATRNNLGPGSPGIVGFDVAYPFEYQPADSLVRAKVRIRRTTVILFAGGLNRSEVELAEEAIAALPQRR